jgi:hypothetical protein
MRRLISVSIYFGTATRISLLFAEVCRLCVPRNKRCSIRLVDHNPAFGCCCSRSCCTPAFCLVFVSTCLLKITWSCAYITSAMVLVANAALRNAYHSFGCPRPVEDLAGSQCSILPPCMAGHLDTEPNGSSDSAQHHHYTSASSNFLAEYTARNRAGWIALGLMYRMSVNHRTAPASTMYVIGNHYTARSPWLHAIRFEGINTTIAEEDTQHL